MAAYIFAPRDWVPQYGDHVITPEIVVIYAFVNCFTRGHLMMHKNKEIKNQRETRWERG
jgi:hypothetical protein